jgi:hypothetical protein
MPSQALLDWHGVRLPRLVAVDAQCAATLALVPPPALADENLRGYVMLLSAHLQGFRRDLYSECAQRVAAAVPPPMQFMVQTQGLAARTRPGQPASGDHSAGLRPVRLRSPHGPACQPGERPPDHASGTIELGPDLCRPPQDRPPRGRSPTLAAVQGWRTPWDGLATEFDANMHNQLLAVIGAPTW